MSEAVTVFLSWLAGRRASLRPRPDPTLEARGASEAAATGLNQDVCAYAATILGDAREDLARADNKASILLATTGIVAGVILAAMLATTWAPTALGFPWTQVWIVGAVIGVGGVGCLVWAVYPRMAREHQETVALYYFLHAAELKSLADVRFRLEAGAVDPLARLSHQIFHVSRIARDKYRWIQRGIRATAMSAILMLVSALAPEIARLITR